MKRREFLATAAAAPALLAQTGAPPRIRRKDAFFGLHFDLHPNKSDTILGRDVTDEMVGRLLQRVRPDYVQYDCKGHPGYLGYPSKVGPTAPGIVRDSLEIWRRQTAQRGIALFIHFSGVWDSAAVEQHPEWARVDAKGNPDKRQTSTFGPYVDARMIPQLREAAAKYNLDGAWVDGECWATAPDYSPAALKAWGKPAPKGPEDPGWLDFLEFNRERFRRYVTHYINELHKTNPNFQIASNWMYTTFVPERPTVPLDFVSGDYLGNAAISTARLDARYCAMGGMPWDLMAWGFQRAESNPVGVIHKPAVQLQQEAAVVLAQGGGFQVYYHPPRGGHFDDRLVAVMEGVARFCRDRQEFCHKSDPIPQVGLLFSKHTLYQRTNKLFGGWGAATNPARGLLDALLEAQYSVDVIPDWKLDEVASGYPLIAVPDWAGIGSEAHATLRRYVEAGGRLLLVGADHAGLFANELGVKMVGEPKDQPAHVAGDALLGNVRGRWQQIEPGEPAQVVALRYATFDTTRDTAPAATLSHFGKGQILTVYGPIGTAFAHTHDPSTRQFLKRLIGRFWTPDLQVSAPPSVEVALRRKNGNVVLHLSNTVAMQVAGDYAGLDYVPAAGPVRISMKLPRAPKAVWLQPEKLALEGRWDGSSWTGTIRSVHLHSMLVFES